MIAFSKDRTIEEWSALVGISTNTIYQRIKAGWPVDKACTQPLAGSDKACTQPLAGSITYDGETLSQREWAERLGIKRTTLHMRIKAGWPVAQALGFEPRPNMLGRPKRHPGVDKDFCP